MHFPHMLFAFRGTDILINDLHDRSTVNYSIYPAVARFLYKQGREHYKHYSGGSWEEPIKVLKTKTNMAEQQFRNIFDMVQSSL